MNPSISSDHATAEKLALRAALAIINSTVNPALRHDASNVTAPLLAEIIERETAVSELYEALHKAVAYFERAYGSGALAYLGGRIGATEVGALCHHPARFDLDEARAVLAKARGERL